MLARPRTGLVRVDRFGIPIVWRIEIRQHYFHIFFIVIIIFEIKIKKFINVTKLFFYTNHLLNN